MFSACGRIRYGADFDVITLKIESVLCHKSFAFYSDHLSNTLKVIGSLVVSGHNKCEMSVRAID